MRKINKHILILIALLVISFSLFSQKGKHGAAVITGNGAIFNRYTPLIQTAIAGQSFVVINNINDLEAPAIPGAINDPYGANTVEACDLLMIIKMQGSSMTTGNTSSYGNITSYNGVGDFELFEVGSVNINTISISAGCKLNNTYVVSSTQRVQVIRIPRLTTLSINNGGALTSRPWGQVAGTGGVVAIETNGAVIINGTVTTQGQGYRGGAAVNAGVAPNSTNYVSTLNSSGGEKGESIAGAQTDYDILSGRYSRGAPANGGGGGNSDNAGGGGGSNSGNLAGYTGMGNPDISFPTWITSWNLESASFATSTSPGGGRGGYSRSMNNANAQLNGPSDPAWAGDLRNNIGGNGGKPLDYLVNTRLFLGGGGGAGHGDNGNNAAGADGGGIIYFISDGGISGTGLINANGDDASPTTGAHNDAPGGGGGGGAIAMFSNNSITGLTLTANGGNGGDQLIVTNEAEGPGGGGGGGYIKTTTTGVSTSVSGGLNGNTTSAGLTEFIPNGATKGASGTILNNLSFIPYSAPVNLSVSILSNTPLCISDVKSYTVTINNLACNSASNVVVNIPAPSGVTFTLGTPSTGTYAAPNWTIANVLPNSPISIVLTGAMSSTNIGVFGATVTSSSPECATANNVTTTPSQTVIKVVINAIAIPTVICLGSIATLSANGASTYTWFPGNMTGPTPTVSPTVATIYTVVGNVTTCIGSQTVQLLVNPIPTLNATAAPTLICPGGTGTLNATGALTYTWLPGFLVGATQTVIGSFPQQYTVVGTDANGCTNFAVVNLPVFVPTITAYPTQICIGECSTLTAFGANSYTWTPGNIVSPSIAVCPTVSTLYQVSGTHPTGCIAYTSVVVIVWPIPTVQAIANPTRICQGQTSWLTASGALSYYWLAPLNTPSNPVAVQPTVTTTYTVVGNNINGCADTTTVTVIVDPLPTITAVPNPTQICRGNSSTITTTGALSYTWFPSFPIATGSTIVVTPSVTTNYTVVGTNTFGCINYAYATVIVGPNITAVAIPSVVCAGNSSSLIAGGGQTYTWQPGNQNGSVIVVTPTASGFYTVVITDNIGCKDSAQVHIQVNPNPTIIASVTPSICCAGDNVTLTATGANMYAWNPGALTGNTVSLFATGTTVYTVTGTTAFGCSRTETVLLTVNNCSVVVPIGLAKKAAVTKNDNYIDYYVELSFVVKNYATYPVYNVQINDNLNNTFPAPSTFTVVPPPVSINSFVTVDPSFSGQGSNMNLLVANSSSLLPGQTDTIKVIVKFTPNGIVSFTNSAIASAGNLPSGGYTGSDVSTTGNNPDPNGNNVPSDPNEGIPTVFEVEFDFFIPQGFSPNDDGVNDLFEIRGIRFFPDNELQIINRWGNVVYRKKGYDNTWDGTTEIGIEIGGNKLPEGTYYYILDLNNKTKPYTGFLYLNRGLTK